MEQARKLEDSDGAWQLVLDRCCSLKLDEMIYDGITGSGEANKALLAIWPARCSSCWIGLLLTLEVGVPLMVC